MQPNKLSDKARAILEAIAKGHTYEQILVQDLAWTYHDIFQAATDALELAEFAETTKNYDERMAEIKLTHPKAYQPWTIEDDARLTECFRSSARVFSVEELAGSYNVNRAPFAAGWQSSTWSTQNEDALRAIS